MSGFKASGLWPFNTNIFQDYDLHYLMSLIVQSLLTQRKIPFHTECFQFDAGP